MVALAAAGTLVLAACSSPYPVGHVFEHGRHVGDTGSGSSATTTTTAAPGSSALTAIGPIPAADVSPAGTAGHAPTVKVPTGPRPPAWRAPTSSWAPDARPPPATR